MRLHPSVVFLLFLTPLFVYGSAIFADYGLRDDYSITRESHEEPGKTLAFTASHGRPLYGVFLEASFSHIRGVSDLAWLRLISAILIGGFGLVLYRQLRANGWELFDAAAASLTVVYLPASQVTISWAVGWPWGISLMLAVSGFGMLESAWKEKGFSRGWRVTAAILAYMLATAIYQSNTLFAAVLIASVLVAPQPRIQKPELMRWLLLHLGTLFTSLILSYGLLKILFVEGIFHESGRLQFEAQFISKLIWFLTQPLTNAIAFFTLRDDFNTGAFYFWTMTAVVLLLISWAIYKQSCKNRLNWLLCLLLLPWIAHGISLVAAERSLGYRTLFALSGLFVVMLFAALREVTSSNTRYVVISLIVVVSALLAHQQSYYLIAQPQGREWSMIREAVAKIQPDKPISIFLIEPKPVDRSTVRVYRDEFGSFTTNSEWAPTEMFKLAMHEQFPGGLPNHGVYDFEHGGDPPPATDHYDQIIDVRTLKQWRK